MVISQVVEDIYIQVNQEKLFSLKNGQQIKLFTKSEILQHHLIHNGMHKVGLEAFILKQETQQDGPHTKSETE